MPCICSSCNIDCAAFKENICFLGACIYRYDSAANVYVLVDRTVPGESCDVEGYPACAPTDYFSLGCDHVADEYQTIVRRQRYYLNRPKGIIQGRYAVLRCYCAELADGDRCVTRCLKNDSVYYIEAHGPCRDDFDCCYCAHELRVCGSKVNSMQPEVSSYCIAGFPMRRRCRDHFCQYICDREGSNVYKFRLVNPCPEGCMCKPVFLKYDFWSFYDGNIYDGECCPANYGSTITIACLDDDDPIINRVCPVDVDTCQIEVVGPVSGGQWNGRVKIIVHDKCHMERIHFLSSFTGRYNECFYHDFGTFNCLPCVCSILASIHNHATCGEEPFIREGDQLVVYVNCQDTRLWSSPCHVCDVQPGTVIEALCAYNEV
jgi:hypothetical protein